jgi:hypothetical protein
MPKYPAELQLSFPSTHPWTTEIKKCATGPLRDLRAAFPVYLTVNMADTETRFQLDHANVDYRRDSAAIFETIWRQVPDEESVTDPLTAFETFVKKWVDADPQYGPRASDIEKVRQAIRGAQP